MVVHNNQIAVLISTAYGYGWSTCVSDNNKKKNMLMNDKIVDYVMECRKNKESPNSKRVHEIWISEFPDYPVPELRGVHQLAIFWVEKGTSFQVRHMNGAEYIYFPSDDNNWITV